MENALVQSQGNMVQQQQYPQRPMMVNPFQQQRGYMPDIAIKDPTTAMFDSLLSDDNVPIKLKERYWFVFHRDNTLGFQDKERKASKMLSFDILKIDALNNMSYYDYTFESEMEWNAARQMMETKLDRAVGNGKVNERLAIPMTITENRQISEDNTSQQRQSFLSRMLNRK